MTRQEYNSIRATHAELSRKENRSEKEQALYIYLDCIIQYVTLRECAIRMGNKTPDNNFLIKDAKEKMETAKKEYASV